MGTPKLGTPRSMCDENGEAWGWKNTSGEAHVISTSPFTMALDYDSNNNLIYLGKAVAGTAQASTGWLIKKLIYDANNNLTDIQNEGGDTAFDAIWDNRAALSYS